MATILLADNHQEFLNVCKELLENMGYQVLTAVNPQEAKQRLMESPIDLAILDIRLENDNDEADISGLIVAREIAPSVPKIILTGFPSLRLAREALGRVVSRLPAAINFLDKQEGGEELLRAVQTALNIPQVLIVHESDEEAKDIITRFVEELGGWTVVLRDRLSRGYSLVEKFEDSPNIGFVVVLLTPAFSNQFPGEMRDSRLRPQQNVIFELGYFLGKLGPRKVSVLFTEGVEIPSDIFGVSCRLFDSEGDWKLSLAREMKATGLDIDLNKVS